MDCYCGRHTSFAMCNYFGFRDIVAESHEPQWREKLFAWFVDIPASLFIGLCERLGDRCRALYRSAIRK